MISEHPYIQAHLDLIQAHPSVTFCIRHWMTQTCGFIYCTHTYWSARDARSDFSVCRLTKWGHKYMNNIPRTARRVTSWAFDRFIWVKWSSYHIYIGYRNLKGPHGNLSKYKFGLAEYITAVVLKLFQDEAHLCKVNYFVATQKKTHDENILLQ